MKKNYSFLNYFFTHLLPMSNDAELLSTNLKPKRTIYVILLRFRDLNHPRSWNSLLKRDGLGFFNWFIDNWIRLLNEFNIMNLFDFRLHEEFILLIVHYFIYYINRPTQTNHYLLNLWIIGLTEYIKNQQHYRRCS